jgi:hypothetical protein
MTALAKPLSGRIAEQCANSNLKAMFFGYENIYLDCKNTEKFHENKGFLGNP